jgi:hypothetical protein
MMRAEAEAEAAEEEARSAREAWEGMEEGEGKEAARQAVETAEAIGERKREWSDAKARVAGAAAQKLTVAKEIVEVHADEGVPGEERDLALADLIAKEEEAQREEDAGQAAVAAAEAAVEAARDGAHHVAAHEAELLATGSPEAQSSWRRLQARQGATQAHTQAAFASAVHQDQSLQQHSQARTAHR